VERVERGEREDVDDPLSDSTFVSVVDGEEKDVFVDSIDDVVDVDLLIRTVADSLLLTAELLDTLGEEDNTADFDDDLVTAALTDEDRLSEGDPVEDTECVFNTGGDPDGVSVDDPHAENVFIDTPVVVIETCEDDDGLFVVFVVADAEPD